jgi:hypothetical protein
VFQFAENQTLKTPETTFGSGSVLAAAAAGADVGLSAGFASGLAAGAVVGCPAAAGAAGFVSAGFDGSAGLAGVDADG